MSRRNAVSDAVLERDVPASIRRLDTFAHADYADIVTASGARLAAMSPEQLAHVVLWPDGLRMRAVVGAAGAIQCVVLGFRPSLRASRDNLFGWRIAARGDRWLRLEASSSLLSGHIVLHRDGGRLSFATFVRYERPLAVHVWAAVAPIHRRVAIALVRHAVRAQAPSSVRGRAQRTAS
ncbi:MAG TPA: hypothetical protein VFC09_08575 [Candidatus Dormibacteraeota bacterium]|nr:hypothetical protein [Candidatus Dormibacteraeota bacterium]